MCIPENSGYNLIKTVNTGGTDALTSISSRARTLGKAIALHTHFNHPREITWVTELAAQKLFERGVVVRNQTVLLKGVNDDFDTMKTLIRRLANNNIQPVGYYLLLW